VEPHIAYVERTPLTAIFDVIASSLLLVKTPILKLALFFAAVAGMLAADMRASLAYQSGDSQWCAVTNKGDVMAWDCEYDSSDECASAIAGSGGYCAINPYWHPDPSSNGH
jgi:hypothetical protein